MTAYRAWYSSFASARLLRDKNLSADQLKVTEDIFFHAIAFYEEIGLLQEATQGFEDGVASALFQAGLLEEKPVYTKPPMAEGESFFGGFRTEEYQSAEYKERKAREDYLRAKSRRE